MNQLEAPGLFGRYRIERELGSGAMGAVYLAHDTQLDRPVALKVPKFAAHETAAIQRFYREARAAARLQHPNICPVYDVGEIDGTHYLTMARIAGRPLSAYVRRDQPLPERQAAVLVRKLAQGLHHAHQQGIVHRDLKPDNIMVDDRREPIVMDFGLARHLGSDQARLTQSGMLVGTPAYMSPEQAEGLTGAIGPPADVYALGVVLYELLTGRLPFEGTVIAVLGQMLTKEPQKPSELRPGLDPRLETLCLKMLAKDIGNRCGSMREVSDALAETLKTPKPRQALQPAGPAQVDADPAAPVADPPDEEPPSVYGLSDPLAEPPVEASRVTSPPLRTFDDRSRQRQDDDDKPSRKRRSSPGQSAVKRGRRPASGRRRSPMTLVGLLAFVLLAGVTASLVQPGRETVRIEIDDPAAELVINGQLVPTADGRGTVVLRLGEHLLQVRQDDVVVETRLFQVAKGDNPMLQVRLRQMETVERPLDAETDQAPMQRGGDQQASRSNGSAATAGNSRPSTGAQTDQQEDAATGQEVRTLTGHTASVRSVAFSPDGTRIVSGSWGDTLKVWDVATGQEVRTLTGHTDSVFSVAFSPDGTRIVSGSYDQTLKVWDAATGQEVRTLTGHTAPVTSVAFSPDGTRIVSGSGDQTLKVWDAATGQEVRTLTGHTNWVRSVAFSPDGTRIVSGSGDKTLMIWHLKALARATAGTQPSSPAQPSVASRPQTAGSLVGSQAGEERDDNGLKMKLCWCPPGTFMMGSPPDEQSRFSNEDQVPVTLTRGFWLGKYEVTQGQWRQIMGTEPWKGPSYVVEGADYPAVYVSWDDAVEFCRKLTERERQAARLPVGWEYTLPTEAQWEYACRAGTQTRYSFGDDAARLGEYAWFDDNTRNAAEQYAHEVGRKKANSWGLHDMHGNVWEWCLDGYVSRLTGGRDPQVTQVGSFRVYRGGSWSSTARGCRSAYRDWSSPSFRRSFLGFRLARVPSGQ